MLFAYAPTTLEQAFMLPGGFTTPCRDNLIAYGERVSYIMRNQLQALESSKATGEVSHVRDQLSTLEDRLSEKEFTSGLVLIAEDDEPIALALSIVVEDAGYTALQANNGRQALAYAREHRPALIITDLMMPLMSGQEFIKALRQDVELRVPPIIVMTAADRSYAEALGADGYLPKPFDLAYVERTLHQFLKPRLR